MPERHDIPDWYRGRIMKKFNIPVDEWEKAHGHNEVWFQGKMLEEAVRHLAAMTGDSPKDILSRLEKMVDERTTDTERASPTKNKQPNATTKE